MEITKSKGLQIAEQVITRVAERIKEVKFDGEIYVDTFNNCRETGYVYKVYRNGKDLYIWTFEARNSDNIIKVVSFRAGSCDIHNMFDDEAYANGYQRYKYDEVMVVADDIAKLIIDFASGLYDDDKKKVEQYEVKTATFVRKASNLNELKKHIDEGFGYKERYRITKKIELSDKDFNDLCNNMISDRNYVIENRQNMGGDTHFDCILVFNKHKDFGILIESDGFDYPRYTAIVNMSEVE